MKLTVLLAGLMLCCAALCGAQTSGLTDEEPDRSELGAPLYPGAVFIRTVEGLDPYHKSALYIAVDRMRTIEGFFDRKLPEKMKAFYEDENKYMTVYLLKTWSTFSGKPSREELSKLEREPNIQIYEYDRSLYESLAEYYEKKPGEKHKADAIRTGRTIIQYTFRKSEEYKSAKIIIGTWASSDRDLPVYYKSVLKFDSEGVYTHTFTPDNIEAMVEELSAKKKYEGMNKDELRRLVSGRNPEKGTYVIMRNTITLVSENPVMETETRNGLANVGSVVLSLELINLPRLTFIRSERE